MFCYRCGREFNDGELFCTQCGTQKRNDDSSFPTFTTEREAVTHYFRRGFRYDTVISFLHEYHGISMSVRTLKRRLREYGLAKSDDSISEETVRQIIEKEIKGPSSMLGYRGMWNKLRTSYNITVPRDTVMRILRELDPEASALRKARKLQRRVYTSPGANAAWHIDGYDKLKPYGLPVHGCVDGFSRRVIWLKVCKSNNNPVIPASLFLQSVEEYGMRPVLVQTDCGTENGTLAGIQCLLAGSEDAHRYSSSHSNQRIENWWSHGKRQFTAWVIDYFKGLVHEGKLVLGNHLHMECVWFVYFNLLQLELDRVKQEWNTHCIRKSRHCLVSGVPDELFFLPQLHGHSNCGVQVSETDINGILNQKDIYAEAEVAMNDNDDEISDYFQYLIREENLQYPPQDWMQAKVMYEKIIELSGQ